jgi:hypothetical protein
MAKSPSQVTETLGGLGRLTELRQRLLFVLVALIIFRIGSFIPVPGVNPQALMQFMDSQQGTIIDVFNLFTGGALQRFSLFALGVMPYISASIAAIEERRLHRQAKDYPVHTRIHRVAGSIPGWQYCHGPAKSGINRVFTRIRIRIYRSRDADSR